MGIHSHHRRPPESGGRRSAAADPAGVIDAATETAFGTLARTREAPALHPRGSAYRARVVPVQDGPLPAGKTESLVRLSRGVGIPDPLPDLLGFALRIVDAYGQGHHQDLLLSTTSARPRLRYAFVPTRDPFKRIYTSLLPYRVNGRRCQVIAVPGQAADGPGRFDLFLRYGRSGNEPLARVTLIGPHEQPDGEDIGFDPGNTGDRIFLDGLVNRLRLPAYRGSRRGRRGPSGSARRAVG